MSKKPKATKNLAKDVKPKCSDCAAKTDTCGQGELCNDFVREGNHISQVEKKPIQLDKMSVTELQALGYRIIGLLEKNQADLRMVNEQIAKKV